MGSLISQLKAEGPKVWRQLSLVQRGTLLAVALAAVAATLFIAQSSQETEYSAAFSGLSESDASAIVATLKEQKIPYQLTQGGTTIRVPADQVYEVRLQLASAGLPKGGTVGFELFDKVNFGLTDFAQKLNFQRALEGELARTIGRLTGVEEARVHIALPQSELFVDKEKAATASVVLSLKPGVELDSRQVQGVVNLVSRSVEGLKPENVTVLDGDGVTLSSQDQGLAAGSAGTSTQRDAQRGYERAVQQDLQAMLEQVLGPRKAVVRVNAALDWDQYEATSETYSPNGKTAQVRSAREMMERSSTPLGDGTDLSSSFPTYPMTAGAPAGPVSPGSMETATPAPTPTAEGQTTTAASAATAEPKYERRDVTTNYELSKMVEHTVKAPGTLKKLSVAVMLDGQLDESTVSTVSKAVSAAAGLDSARGDSVVVTSLPFDQTTATERQRATEDLNQREMYMSGARIGLVVLCILVVLLVVRSLVRGLLRNDSQMVVEQTTRGKRKAPVYSSRAAAAFAARAAAAEADPTPKIMQRELSELAKNEPRLVAGIIKTWIDEK